MIDEELYKLATDELNSEQRKPDVWARACALASDDHDEARFLYTNLRVEEMLNKDGKQRTFNSDRAREQRDLSSSEKLDDLELSLDDETTASNRMGVDANNSAPLPIDDIVGFDAENQTTGSVSGNDLSLGEASSFDGYDIDSLAQNNASSDGALSSITGKALNTEIDEPAGADSDQFADMSTQHDTAHEPLIHDDDHIETGLFSGVGDQADTASDHQNQNDHAPIASDYTDAESADTEQIEADNAFNAHTQLHDDAPSPAAESDNSGILADYADDDILHASTLDDDGDELYDGAGRSFMVFGRDGVLKAVKRGVSWPAMFFTLPWLLYKKLIGTAIVYCGLWVVAVGGLIVTASRWASAGGDAAMSLKLWTAAFILLGLIGLFYIPLRYGNQWVAEKLQNAGFEFESAVGAGNKREAITRFLGHG